MNKTWKDITLGQYNQIQEVVRTPDEWTQLNLLDIVYGVDTSKMTVLEIKRFAKGLDFLTEEVPEVKLKQKYTLGGRAYESHFNLACVTMAQFVDYQNYCKQTPVKYEDILSVFLMPKGHDYNDGYDMDEVKGDLLQLDICTVRSLAFFFARQLIIYLEIFRSCSIEEVRRMKLTKAEKAHLEKIYREWDLRSLERYLMSSQSARRQTKPSRM